jgi:hypothetical protein
MYAVTKAVLTKIMAVLGDGSQFAVNVGVDVGPFADRPGSRLVKRPAIAVAAIKFH